MLGGARQPLLWSLKLRPASRPRQFNRRATPLDGTFQGYKQSEKLALSGICRVWPRSHYCLDLALAISTPTAIPAMIAHPATPATISLVSGSMWPPKIAQPVLRCDMPSISQRGTSVARPPASTVSRSHALQRCPAWPQTSRPCR